MDFQKVFKVLWKSSPYTPCLLADIPSFFLGFVFTSTLGSLKSKLWHACLKCFCLFMMLQTRITKMCKNLMSLLRLLCWWCLGHCRVFATKFENKALECLHRSVDVLTFLLLQHLSQGSSHVVTLFLQHTIFHLLLVQVILDLCSQGRKQNIIFR